MKIHPQRFARFLALCIGLPVLLYVFFHLPAGEDGDPPTFKAEILSVSESENEITAFAPGAMQYEVRIRIDSGEAAGTETTITHRTLNNPAFDIHPAEGENIIVRTENDSYAIVDYDRLPAMLFLLIGFAALLILFGGMTGARALLVLLFAVLLIAKGLISLILLAPSHILLWTLLIGMIITLATQLIVNGCNVKSAGAIIGTIGGILVASILAILAENEISGTRHLGAQRRTRCHGYDGKHPRPCLHRRRTPPHPAHLCTARYLPRTCHEPQYDRDRGRALPHRQYWASLRHPHHRVRHSFPHYHTPTPTKEKSGGITSAPHRSLCLKNPQKNHPHRKPHLIIGLRPLSTAHQWPYRIHQRCIIVEHFGEDSIGVQKRMSRECAQQQVR